MAKVVRTIEVELPWPPSTNHMWRHVGSRVLISRKGRAFRQHVCAILRSIGVRAIDGPVVMEIDAYPPDRRRRDIDNIQKALLDALQHGGAYEDDNQIVKLTVVKLEPVKGGMVVVRLRGAA